MTWPRLFRILLFAVVWFAACNGLFALVQPLNAISGWSLYGTAFPLRPRLPTSAQPEQAYAVDTNDLPAMFASHAIRQPKAADEYRVVLLGDSAIWGWRLSNAETLSAQLNALGLTLGGKRAVFYNLAYPSPSITQQLMLMDGSLACCQPEAVINILSGRTLLPSRDAQGLLLIPNAERLRALSARYGVPLPHTDTPEPDFAARTFVGQARHMADLLRLQLLGASWAATGIDQVFPAEYTPRANDLEADTAWDGMAETNLTAADLRFDILGAMQAAADADGVRMLHVDQPLFVADGANSDLRYNAWYPRWALDGYRQLLGEQAAANGWQLLELGSILAPERFTDSPAHFDAQGAREFAGQLAEQLAEQLAAGL